jgi:hypothetical protein
MILSEEPVFIYPRKRGEISVLRNKKTAPMLLGVMALFIFLYATTYLPKNLITINPQNVSKIEIFDGTMGKSLTVTEAADLEHIITNLQEVTFHKGKSSFGYLGYRFRVSIYNENGKKYKELIINSTDVIRYGNFFYSDKTNSIDVEYLSNLFN